jgi:topoisomerase-4 subunit B
LRSKAVLCPSLKITFHNEIDETKDQWAYKDGLKDYLSISLDGLDCLPEKPFVVNYESEKQQLDSRSLVCPENCGSKILIDKT